MRKLKFTQFPARLSKDIAESQGFKQALNRLRNGKHSTPRSWVYEHDDPDKVLARWVKIVQRLNDTPNYREIAEWDLSKVDKFGPQGGVAPFPKRMDTLIEYWSHLSPINWIGINKTEWNNAIADAVRALKLNNSGSPLSVDSVIARGIKEDKYNTSSGDPLFIKRKNLEAIEQAKQAVLNGSWKEFYPTLGSRASMGKVGEAARWIFMFPMAVNLQEQRFTQPLQDYIRSLNLDFFVPWEGYNFSSNKGARTVQQVLSHWGSSTRNNALFFGCDYTKMDQHFNWWHAVECFKVIKHFFSPQYWNELYEVLRNVFYCPVITCDGMLPGPHAMPSGSGWTNLLETIFNFILKFYIKRMLERHSWLRQRIEFMSAMGIGDDQLYLFILKSLKYKSNELLERLTSFIVSIFVSLGLDANEDKQEVSYDVASFLQRRSYTWYNGIKGDTILAGVYPTIRALTSEIFPEFYHNSEFWTSKTFALRCLMIAENCCQHPLFYEFCDFIYHSNDNIGKFIKLSAKEKKTVYHEARKIPNFIPNYTGSNADNNSPDTWASVKYLISKYS